MPKSWIRIQIQCIWIHNTDYYCLGQYGRLFPCYETAKPVLSEGSQWSVYTVLVSAEPECRLWPGPSLAQNVLVGVAVVNKPGQDSKLTAKFFLCFYNVKSTDRNKIGPAYLVWRIRNDLIRIIFSSRFGSGFVSQSGFVSRSWFVFRLGILTGSGSGHEKRFSGFGFSKMMQIRIRQSIQRSVPMYQTSQMARTLLLNICNRVWNRRKNIAVKSSHLLHILNNYKQACRCR